MQQLVREPKDYIYDPNILGFSSSWFKRVSGAADPTVASEKLRLNAHTIASYANHGKGFLEMALNIPNAIASKVAGYLTGGTSATAVIGTWNAVSDGEFAITIDGMPYDITGLDFSGDADMDAVAATIQTGIRAATGDEETCVWDTDHFIITSSGDNALSEVSVTSAVSGGSGTDVSGVGATAFMDAETAVGTATAATNEVGYLRGGTSPTTVIGTWSAVTDGEFSVTIDGEVYNITGIDFSDVTTMAEVASTIQTALRTVTGNTETVTWTGDIFVIQSAGNNDASSVSVTSAVPNGAGTDISGAGTAFLDSESGQGTAVALDGDAGRVFGFKSIAKQTGVYFNMIAGKLTCNVVNGRGQRWSKEVDWDDTWEDNEVLFQISWSDQQIRFMVDGEQLTHANSMSVVVQESLPVLFKNANADNMDLGHIVAKGIERYT